jgi:hypothetical protein
MEITRRPLAPGELDHELLWLSVSFTSLGLAIGWFALRLPWPRCLFHDLTGLPCLTCGMTRSTIAFLHGDFLTALRWNPLVFSALCALSIFNIYAFAVLIARRPRLRIAGFTAAEKKLVRTVVVALLALNWIYLLSHWRNF